MPFPWVLLKSPNVLNPGDRPQGASMRRFSTTVAIALATLLLVSISSAQQTATTSVPNLIRYSGTLKDVQGAALSSSAAVGVTFSIYKQQDGGAAVWIETQNVTPDASGQYSVILGSTTATGLPGDLFSQQEQRWLGVQVQGEAEQARVLLVSVPYAFKAHEAETLGGLPATAFVRARPSDASNGTSVNALGTAGNSGSGANAGKNAASGSPPAPVMNGPCLFGVPVGAQGYIPIWNNPPAGSTVICNSVIFQSPGLNVGIGTTTPMAQLDVSGSIRSSAGYQIGGNNVLLINRTLDNLIVGGDSGSINNGEFNTFSGIDAGFTNGTGIANTFSGAQAGYANSQGQGNTFTGTQTGSRNITGSFNSFFGVSAGLQNNADYNTFVGEDAGFLTTSGSNNTFLGAEAGNSNIGGSANTFSGRLAGFNNTGSNGSFYGYQAGYNNTANGNSFYGREAGFSNTTQSGSAFYGFQSGYSSTIDNTPGFQSGNTFAGYQAGYSNTTDGGNTFVGYQSGFNSNTQQFPGHDSANTFAGYQAGYSNTTGILNAYFGWTAGAGSNGGSNAFFGSNAGKFNLSGSSNVFIGAAAGESSTGSNNTSVGFVAGGSNGDYNTSVGFEAGSNLNAGNNDVYIANLGPVPAGTENNTIRIGGDVGSGYGAQTAAYIAGIYSSTVTMLPTDLVVCVNPAGGLYGAVAGTTCTFSSRRFKEKIVDMGDSSSRLFQLRPVTFFYKPQYDDGSHLLQYGLIAEEVAKVYPDMVAYDKDGAPYTVKYQYLAPMLLNELQKEHAVVAAQQDVIKTQQEEMQTQGQQIAALQERLSRLESLIAKQ